jgi:predicted MFS family arabinose efflux permease
LISDNVQRSRDYRLFIVASILMGLGSCVNSSAFNNYLRDVFQLDVARRTFLELPRELPGFLVSLFVGVLAAIGELRIAMIANFLATAGMLALGWIPSSFILMVGSVFVYSTGTHIYMPLANSIGMGFASKGGEGSVLGRINAAMTAAVVAGSALFLVIYRLLSPGYGAIFSVGAVLYLGAAVALFLMKPRPHLEAPRKFVVRREYGRFYLLSVLYGARKQLFITFGPWMLVSFFGQGVEMMTLLFFVISAAGIGAGPLIGRLTDRFGPRAVLGGEAILIVGVCIVYAFAPVLLPAGAALIVVSACYVVDQTSSSVSMTRAVYVKKLVRSPDEISPTLSLGITIDHAVAMFLPMLGGLAFAAGGAEGYKWVFLGGAVVSALNFFVTRGLPKAEARSVLSGRADTLAGKS